MADIYNEDVMVEETDLETGEGRDLSTIIGVGLIAGGGVVAYEGGKKVVGLVRTHVWPHMPWVKKKAEENGDDPASQPDQAETPNPEVNTAK